MGADGSGGLAEHPWRGAATQVFVGDLSSPELLDDDVHHVTRVLRLAPGALVCVADGLGSWRMCRLRPGALLDPEGDTKREPAATPELTVGFTPVKGERPERVVQRLTEVGVDSILVLETTRSVIRWDPERGERHLQRLRRVAREASQQCRRLWLPTMELVQPGRLPPEAALADAGGRALSKTDRIVFVGPEGGWTNEEREGRARVALGSEVMRSETAAVVAGSAMTSLRLGLSRPGLP